VGAPVAAFRELDASPQGLAELARFYRRRYVAEFPDPNERESLANMRRYLRLKSDGWYGPNNYHILLAELDSELAGGCVFDYLAEPNVGVLEFLFIAAPFRRKGLGKSLFDEAVRVLKRDAQARIGKPLAAIVAEMNDPFRPGATPDNLDPFQRCVVWGGWGFFKLDFPYLQPALSREQAPVDGLALITKPFSKSAATGYRAQWLLSIVGEYMRWAMRIRDPARNREYRCMARYLAGRARVPLIPLQAYVGRDPRKPLRVRELGAGDASFRRAIAIARDAIPRSGRVASDAEFRRALAATTGRGGRYHLWGLWAPSSPGVEGMASFFALRPAGFGGYIALTRRLRGRGLLRSLVARIEERMIRDGVGAHGWFIECGGESVDPFLRVGFAEIAVDYRPPPVGRGAGGREPRRPERLHLLYKPFGAAHGGPQLTRRFILNGVAAILGQAYGIDAPRAHDCYRRVRETLVSTRSGGAV